MAIDWNLFEQSLKTAYQSDDWDEVARLQREALQVLISSTTVQVDVVALGLVSPAGPVTGATTGTGTIS